MCPAVAEPPWDAAAAAAARACRGAWRRRGFRSRPRRGLRRPIPAMDFSAEYLAFFRAASWQAHGTGQTHREHFARSDIVGPTTRASSPREYGQYTAYP